MSLSRNAHSVIHAAVVFIIVIYVEYAVGGSIAIVLMFLILSLMALMLAVTCEHMVLLISFLISRLSQNRNKICKCFNIFFLDYMNGFL